MKVRLCQDRELHLLDTVPLLQDGQRLRSQGQARRGREREVARKEPLLIPPALRHVHPLLNPSHHPLFHLYPSHHTDLCICSLAD